MVKRSDIQKKRIKAADELDSEMRRRIKVIQDRIYTRVLELSAGFVATEDGNLSFSLKNINRSSLIEVRVLSIQRKETLRLLKWLFKGLQRIFRLNTSYFKSSGKEVESIEERVRRLLMARYGYDVRKNKLIKGRVLTRLTTNENLALSISRQVNNALAARISLQEFRKQLQRSFINPNGLGMVERHFRTFTNDIFAEFDRTVQREYASTLGLQFAIYSPSSIIKTSRDFCERRVGNIYDLATINSWDSQQWKGKKQGVPTVVAAGGHNCRHHFHFIDEKDAELMLKRRGRILNQLN